MSRLRTLMVYTLVTLALATLFVAFIVFKKDGSLIAALEAAGTVSAAGFAAVAAMGSRRAAAESSATAKRSREALARSMRPRIAPSIGRENGTLAGTIRCDGRAAVDVTVVWVLTDRGAISERTGHLDPGTALSVDLGLPESATGWDELTAVWIEYRDDVHAGHWRDTWQVDTDAPGGGHRLLQTDSQLVD